VGLILIEYHNLKAASRRGIRLRGYRRWGMTGTEDSVGGAKQKFTIFPHNLKDKVPAYTSIIAPTVAKNGLPRMMGPGSSHSYT